VLTTLHSSAKGHILGSAEQRQIWKTRTDRQFTPELPVRRHWRLFRNWNSGQNYAAMYAGVTWFIE
jgi:hypothetical protein